MIHSGRLDACKACAGMLRGRGVARFPAKGKARPWATVGLRECGFCCAKKMGVERVGISTRKKRAKWSLDNHQKRGCFAGCVPW